MNSSNMIFGQYINKDSWIHSLDPRTKIITLFLMMIAVFVINNLYILLGCLAFCLIIVLTSKIPFSKFLKSFKMVATLLIFTTVFQIIFNTSGDIVQINNTPLTVNFTLTVINLSIGIVLLILYFISGKFIKKWRILSFLAVIALAFFLQTVIKEGPVIVDYSISLYDKAFFSASRVLVRIINLITLSALLTFTTKPIDLNKGIEGLFKPFKFMKRAASIMGMMISIVLRSIPTLIKESQKILKAQASRGVDFNEGSIKEKIAQIISLLVPMFVISYKKSEDLADAMDARGYIPGEERTSLEILKYAKKDYFTYIFLILFLLFIIFGKIYWVI